MKAPSFVNLEELSSTQELLTILYLVREGDTGQRSFIMLTASAGEQRRSGYCGEKIAPGTSGKWGCRPEQGLSQSTLTLVISTTDLNSPPLSVNPNSPSLLYKQTPGPLSPGLAFSVGERTLAMLALGGMVAP